MVFSATSLMALLKSYKYFLLFPLAVIEGPIVTILAAFLASMGYMNLAAVYSLVLVSDVVGDTLYYGLGRWGGRRFIQRWGKYFGIKLEHLSHLEHHFKHHHRKTLVIGKLTHVFGVVVLVAAGLAEVPLGEFILFTLIPTIPKSLFFLYLGVYFGEQYAKINSTMDSLVFASSFLLIVPLAIFLTPRLFTHFFKKEQGIA